MARTTAMVAAESLNEDGSRPVIKVSNLTKVYRAGETTIRALDSVTTQVERGEMVAIMGQSGSGKSTLMNILGCLDVPTDGDYWLDGEYVADMNEGELARIRNAKIGFIFQSYNLLPRLKAIDQVRLPLQYRRQRQRKRLAQEALALVGLADRMNHSPNRLSGGEQQRVAIARALVTDPEIILADEPTGNLDSATSNEIMELLTRLNYEQKITTILVTHEIDIAALCRRVITLLDGRIESDVTSRWEPSGSLLI